MCGQAEAVGWGRAVCTNADYPSRNLVESEIQIGRKSSCALQLRHAAISGVHCILHHLADSHLTFLTDVSTNGTWIDGRKAEKGRRVLVGNGSEIVLIRNNTEKISYHIYHHHAQQQRRQQQEEQGGPHAKYELGEPLGTGAFAVVKQCVNRETGEKFAMKIIEKKKFMLNHASRRGEALMDEVRILQRLNHPHIIAIHDVFETERQLYLVLELVTGGDLFDKIIAQHGRGFSEQRSHRIFSQMIDATAYLHSHNVVHRDLKPENVLLCRPDSDDIKLSDFGLSRIVGDGSTMKTLCGTPQYLAPEVLNDELSRRGYDKAVDLWSLGVVLYVLLTGMAPFNENKNLVDEVKNGRYSFPAQHWASKSRASVQLIRSLLCMDPAKRWTVEQVKQSDWMRTAAAGPPVPSLTAGAGGGSGAGAAAVAAAMRVNGKRKGAPALRGADEKKGKSEDSKEEQPEEAVIGRRGRSARQR